MSRRFMDLRFTSARASDILNNPHAVFATDLVYFLSIEYRTMWNPPGLRNYIIHDLSPFDHAMRRATIILVRSRDEDYNRKYDDLVGPDADEKLGFFVEYVRFVLSTLISEDRGVIDVFLHLVYIARLSLVFHQRGTPDAPALATVLIAQAMSELHVRTNGYIYWLLSDFAKGVTEDQA